MSHLTSAQLGELKQRLLEEREALSTHFRLHEDTDHGTPESLRASTGELSAYDNHPADLGTEIFERGRDMAIDDSISDQLTQTDAALKRMEEGDYGHCAECGEPISYERLKAIPQTDYCIEHTPQRDRADRERPVEEEVITPPPSGAGEGRQRASGRFDDAGAWDTLERYGNSDSPAMAAKRDVADYGEMSSTGGDRDGRVEALENFAATDLTGRKRHVERADSYREYVKRGEGEAVAEDQTLEPKKS